MKSSSQSSSQENFQHAGEELLQLMLRFKDFAILMFDVDGRVIASNLGAELIYGFSGEEVIGKHFSEFYKEDQIQSGQPLRNLEIAKQAGKYEYEGWKYKKDGSKFYANTIITVLYNKDNSLKGFAKVTRDITVRKKLEEENNALTRQLEEKVKQRTKELEVVNKELEAFSYSVSHDLRTPLRAISGYSIMLKEDYQAKLDAEGNRIIDVIVDNTKMMGKLIDDLLTFSKMARLEMVNSSIDMKQLAESCMSQLLQIYQRKFYTVLVQDMPKCKGDENMLRQVWTNLIGNALKYSSEKSHPKVEIGATEDDNFCTYYVKDNGTGFDMKYSKNLFGVFQRLHRQDQFEGTGLGLALSKRIVSKHGGEIWGEASLNEGATFYFSLPKN